MALSTTQLTLRHLRAAGWPAVAIVEHWNGHVRIRQDLFGIIDVLAVGPAGTLAVQTTTRNEVPKRVRKIADAPHVGAMREAGWSIVVHGWEKQRGRWVLAREVDCS
ncbi:MAG: hypothetical protein ACRCW4_00420 [Candidatus Neomicrothrix subdominans]